MSSTLAFGDDRSAEADRCWEWISNHQWDGWALEVVTTEAPAGMQPVPPEEAELHPWQADHPRDATGLGFVSVEHLRAELDPRVALIARPWELVAIGPRGSGVLKTLHLGSTADWLLRQPTSPLLIAHRGERVKRILICADGSDHSGRAIETLVSLPWMRGLELRLIAVDDGRIDPEAALKTASELLGGSDADIETVTAKGGPTKAILREIDKAQPDLVVMGARGRAGLKRLVLGSTTSAVTRSADTSLLVAHAREG
ncbi:MAG TPA: universal stress protein [Acidimicrobiia bacterium]|nr:universal stress protein [Acidimicrobiia bacterium]